MTRILLLEDDASLIDGLAYSLKKNDFDVEIVRTVKDALRSLHLTDRPPKKENDTDVSSTVSSYANVGCDTDARPCDLLLLDVTLPDGTGFEVCEKVRRQDRRIPIIFLTASDEEVNVIRGLDCGGDDYITKPFKIGELCSRIRALLRRTGNPNAALLSSGSLAIDLTGCRVTLDGHQLDLTGAEYRLLCLLVRNADQVVTRNRILNELWDSAGDFVDDNTLSVYVRRLREKIEADPSHPKRLVTVRGFGYQWMSCE